MQVLWTLLRLIRSSESPSYKSSVAVYLQEFLKSKWEGMAPLCELQVFWSSVRKSSWKSVIQTALWQSHGVIRRRGPIFQEDPWGVHCVYRDDFEFVGSFLFNCTHPWPGDCVSEAAAGSWAQSGCVTLCCVFPAGCGCVFLSPSGEAAAPDRGQPLVGAAGSGRRREAVTATRHSRRLSGWAELPAPELMSREVWCANHMSISCCRFAIPMQEALWCTSSLPIVGFSSQHSIPHFKGISWDLCVSVILMAVKSSVCGISGMYRALRKYSVSGVCI